MEGGLVDTFPWKGGEGVNEESSWQVSQSMQNIDNRLLLLRGKAIASAKD